LKSEGQALRGTLETSNWKLDTSKLGSFCAFHSPAEPQPTRQPPLPTYPIPPKFGFVLHDSLRETPAPGRNWVRFAQSLFGRAPRPAGPRPFPGARAKFGSFCTITFGGGAEAEGSGAGEAPAGTPGRNWVRFAHLACGAGPRPASSNPRSRASRRQIGFVSHATPPAGVAGGEFEV
jgi:hypothetical protein